MMLNIISKYAYSLIFFGLSACSNLLPVLKIALFPSYWAIDMLYTFWIQVLIRHVFCKSFLSVIGLSFHDLNSVFWRAEYFLFWCSAIYQFFPMVARAFCVFWNLSSTQGHKVLLFFFFLINVLGFTLGPTIHFKLIFAYDVKYR